MENLEWKDVTISLMGKEIDFVPISYDGRKKSNLLISKYEGEITITESEIDAMKLPRIRKITNFQRKKMWKRFYKQFGLSDEYINFIFKNNSI